MAHVAIVGTGVIGASWVALFAAHGHEVRAADPRPDAADALRAAVDRCWPSLERQGLVAEGASPDLVGVTATVADAVDGAAFVQENAPERLEVKLDLYREIDAVAASDVVIASSSSGTSSRRRQATTSTSAARSSASPTPTRRTR